MNEMYNSYTQLMQQILEHKRIIYSLENNISIQEVLNSNLFETHISSDDNLL